MARRGSLFGSLGLRLVVRGLGARVGKSVLRQCRGYGVKSEGGLSLECLRCNNVS